MFLLQDLDKKPILLLELSWWYCKNEVLFTFFCHSF